MDQKHRSSDLQVLKWCKDVRAWKLAELLSRLKNPIWNFKALKLWHIWSRIFPQIRLIQFSHRTEIKYLFFAPFLQKKREGKSTKIDIEKENIYVPTLVIIQPKWELRVATGILRRWQRKSLFIIAPGQRRQTTMSLKLGSWTLI